MNKTASTIGWLHGTSFTIFFIINTVLEFFVYPAIEKALASDFWLIIISTIISAFLYLVIYLIALNIYKVFTFRKLTKKLKRDKLWVKGTWYHVHIPFDNDGEMIIDSLRAGEAIFEQSLYDVKIKVAKNDSFALTDKGELLQIGNRHTQWTWPYTFVINDEHLQAIYDAGTTHDTTITQYKCNFCGQEYPEGKEIRLAGHDRIGVHTLTIESENLIAGTYHDCVPSINHGSIKFFRNKEDRDNEIREYFKRVEYLKQKEREQNEKV